MTLACLFPFPLKISAVQAKNIHRNESSMVDLKLHQELTAKMGSDERGLFAKQDFQTGPYSFFFFFFFCAVSMGPLRMFALLYFCTDDVICRYHGTIHTSTSMKHALQAVKGGEAEKQWLRNRVLLFHTSLNFSSIICGMCLQMFGMEHILFSSFYLFTFLPDCAILAL